VSLTLGVFDIFAYSIPGALYLALILYVLNRTSWVEIASISHVNPTILIIGGILASYLLGHLTYIPRRYLEQYVPRSLKGTRSALQEFRARVPAAAGRGFVDADSNLLLAAIELKARESAVEISRLRASGIALRNAAFALLLSALTAAVELIVGHGRGLAACCLPLFFAGVLTALRAGFMLSRWATLKTYEVAFWLPEIETHLRGRCAGGNDGTGAS
jgi:hypothetical protein